MHILRPVYYLTTGMHSYPKLDIIFSLLFDFSRRFLLVKELLPGPVTILLQRKKKCDLSVRKFDTFCSAFLVTTLNQVTMILFTRVGELESWSSVTGVQHIKESCIPFKNKKPSWIESLFFCDECLISQGIRVPDSDFVRVSGKYQ